MNILIENDTFRGPRSSASRASRVRPDAPRSSASDPLKRVDVLLHIYTRISRADAQVERVPGGSFSMCASGRTQIVECVPDALSGRGTRIAVRPQLRRAPRSRSADRAGVSS